MSMTPQDNARSAFSQSQSTRQVFPTQPNLPSPSPAQQHQQRTPYPRPTQGGIRPPQHNSPYTTPYTPTSVQAQPGKPGQNGIQNGNMGVSAEQQILQGVLSNPSSGSGSNTPQRRPPPLGTTIHMPPHDTPQNQPMNLQNVQNQSMSVNHAINPTSAMNQSRQSQNASPLLSGPGPQRPGMNGSPAGSSMSRTQGGSPNDTQDLSMIDPQLAIDQQLTADPDNSMLAQESSPIERPVVQGDMLSAPPGGSYPTFDTLFAHAQQHALAHGYAFVIGRSKRDNRGLKKVFLICDKGGTNKEKVAGEQRQRKTKSRKCGCEFGVFGLETKTCWILRGRIDGEHLTHNHPPSGSPTEHPGARKLDPKAIAAVKALEENGVSVKETLEILHRENPTVKYLPRDIYNARAAIKRDPSRVEATAMEQLPTFYKKPPMTFEEKLRAELRTEVANAQAEIEKTKEEWRKEVEDLKEQLRQKDKMISKFEMFIDICNERVMVQRERLEGEAGDAVAG